MLPAWQYCTRCNADTIDDVTRMLDHGGVPQCSCCGLELPDPPKEWMRANGYEVEE